MHSFLLKSTLVSNSALPFRKFLVSEFLLGISETLHCSNSAPHAKNYPSTRCASAANVVCRDVDVFGAEKVLLNNFYNML
jgi:hypothetical protein